MQDSPAIAPPEKVAALRALIDAGHMDVHFQPVWDLDAGEVLGFEALSRLPEGCPLAGPGDAFELAERIGWAHELDAVCRAAALARAGELPAGASLFLNVAPQTLDRDALSGDALQRAVATAGLPPERLILELTEQFPSRLSKVVAEADRLRALGFRIALDDVGAGNCGLELLRRVTVDFVKVDRSVVSAALHDRSARAVLEAIVAYARRTDAYVIAEGIESREMLDLVRGPLIEAPDGAWVRGGQGYLLGRPGATPQATAPEHLRAA
jgi:EAL domain-containing protein (putative c-di-GMP-specific phosphodiesterase class I)